MATQGAGQLAGSNIPQQGIKAMPSELGVIVDRLTTTLRGMQVLQSRLTSHYDMLFGMAPTPPAVSKAADGPQGRMSLNVIARELEAAVDSLRAQVDRDING